MTGYDKNQLVRGLLSTKKAPVFFVSILLLVFSGCIITDIIGPTDLKIFKYHGERNLDSLRTYTSRLYEKNPCYQYDPVWRQKRLAQLFGGSAVLDEFAGRDSAAVLAEAFSETPGDPDRVYLLALGLVKSIREAYGLDDDGFMFSGLQIPLERLKRLHFNLSQVNWRIKTYKDTKGVLLFRTNEVGEDGYINMGYEVLMTEILTRIEDDIYLRGGLPHKYMFSMSSLFVSLLL
nr:hypothetical protein [Desulfobulbaceae bacterium]